MISSIFLFYIIFQLTIQSTLANFLEDLSTPGLVGLGVGVVGGVVISCLGGVLLSRYCCNGTSKTSSDHENTRVKKQTKQKKEVKEVAPTSDIDTELTFHAQTGAGQPVEKDAESALLSVGETKSTPTKQTDADKILGGVTVTSAKERRRKKGLSYGRLDPEAQERVQSARLQASQLNVIFQHRKPPPAAGDSFNSSGIEFKGDDHSNIESAVSKPSRTKEEVKKRVAEMARRAGGGVYNTGASTARLSAQIVGGFSEIRQKNEELMKKEAEEKAKEEEMKEQKRKQEMTAEQRRMEELNKMKPGTNKLNAFLNSTKETVDEERVKSFTESQVEDMI